MATDEYCKGFVEDIFQKHDANRNNVLERNELKDWVRAELRSNRFFNKGQVQKNFQSFFDKVDSNRDGRIDRWELYDYCIHHMGPDSP